MKQKIYRDPVCGKKINRQRAKILIKHKGYGYFLCCPLCQREFEQNPDKYANHEFAYKIPVKNIERRRRRRRTK